MRILQLILIVTSAILPGSGFAQRAPVVVELFTSQGCSSCPPADEILAEIAEWPDVIALALHVDYWDYLGWKDSFGQEAHSRRQRAYAKAAGQRSIYTPQMVVQGADHVVGANRERLTSLIAAHQARAPDAELEIARDGASLRVSVAPASTRGVGPSEIFLVRFAELETVAIERGENAGQAIDYANIVTDWSSVARWDGRSPAEFSVDAPGPVAVAVIVQRERLGPVLTAASLP
jgi:hypothetical protein